MLNARSRSTGSGCRILALDLGVASIGAAVADCSDAEGYRPYRLVHGCVSIFPRGQSPSERRSLRTARKRQRARIWRRDELLGLLKACGVYAGEATAKGWDRWLRSHVRHHYDTLHARALAAESWVDPATLVLALLHMQRHRGQRASVFAVEHNIGQHEESTDALWGEVGKAFRKEMERSEARTAGQLLLQAVSEGQAVRGVVNWPRFDEEARQEYRSLRQAAKRQGNEAKNAAPSLKSLKRRRAIDSLALVPTREVVADELDAIAERQRNNPALSALSDDDWQKIRNLVVEQRPLVPPEPGRCALLEGEPRAPRCLPSLVELRLLQTVNHLRVRESPLRRYRPLGEMERQSALGLLAAHNEPSTARLLTAIRGVGDAVEVKGLKASDKVVGDPVTPRLRGMIPWWDDLDRRDQDELIATLYSVRHDPAELRDAVDRIEFDGRGLDADDAEALRRFFRVDAASAPIGGYARHSLMAVRLLLPHLRQGLSIVEAAAAEDLRPPEPAGGQSRLPYYGQILRNEVRDVPARQRPNAAREEAQWGRISNMTVHVALNELRKTYNALARRFGPFDRVVIELSRDLKLSPRAKAERDRENKRNREENAKRLDEAREAFGGKLPVSDQEALKRLQHHRRQAGVCPYTGQPIELTDALSGACAIDHIVPVGGRYNGRDIPGNRVLTFSWINNWKKEQLPTEAFAATPRFFASARVQHRNYEDLLVCAERILPQQAWRFARDAGDRLAQSTEDTGFLPRADIDTSYMARLAATYLKAVCADVVCTKGRITGRLRHSIGLGEKDRGDHRHHFEDACLIAITNRSLINAVNRASARNQRLPVVEAVPSWPTFVEDVHAFRHAIGGRGGPFAPHVRPEHGLQGQMHEQQLYGFRPASPGAGPDSDEPGTSRTPGPDERGYRVMRKPVEWLFSHRGQNKVTEKDARQAIESFADEAHAERFQRAVERRMQETGEGLAEACLSHCRAVGTRRIKCSVERSSRPVRRGDLPFVTRNNHPAYVMPGSNHCARIWEMPDRRWAGDVISLLDAATRDEPPLPDDSRLLMKIHKDDVLALDFGDGRELHRVYKFDLHKGKPRLFLCHVCDARPRSDLPKGDPAFQEWGPAKLRKRNARRVTVLRDGRVLDECSRTNWSAPLKYTSAKMLR